MVESEANELPEDVMLGAVVFGHQQQQAVIDLIHSVVEEGGKPLWDWKAPAKDEALIAAGHRRRRRRRCARPTRCARSRRASRR